LSEPFVEKQNCSEVVFVTNYAADGLVDGPERFQVVPANFKGLVQVNKIVPSSPVFYVTIEKLLISSSGYRELSINIFQATSTALPVYLTPTKCAK
jgi:hypothetical protein